MNKLKVMKPRILRIFVYGDSNTWGYYPTLDVYSGDDSKTKRFDKEKIWWYALERDNIVFTNGNNGRTINCDHPDLSGKNSLKTIDNESIDEKLDLVIIMLGTNDLKDVYHLTSSDIVNNMDILVNKFINKYQSKIMIVCPPLILPTVVTKPKYTNSIERVKEYEKLLEKYCVDNNYLFVTGINCEVGIDGEHLTEKGHKELGEIVLKKLEELPWKR